MATLYLDRAQLELRVDGDALAMYEGGERRGTVPTKLLERVVIQGRQTRLETGVLARLGEAGATTLIMSPRKHRRLALVLGPCHNDAGIRIAQVERFLDTPFCEAWGRDLISAKLQRQQRLLKQAMVQRPDASHALKHAVEALSRALEGIGASNTPGLNTLRGMEGAAARAYFQAFTHLFAPALRFGGRNRRPPRDPVNACLSLAYTLLHFDAVRAAHMAGLDPLIGFYHRPSFGRESLASDLIEPLRPVTDGWVWSLFRSEILRPDHFSQDGDACLLGKAGRQQFYEHWESHAPRHRRWLRARCTRLARHLRDEGQRWLEDEHSRELEMP